MPIAYVFLNTSWFSTLVKFSFVSLPWKTPKHIRCHRLHGAKLRKALTYAVVNTDSGLGQQPEQLQLQLRLAVELDFLLKLASDIRRNC